MNLLLLEAEELRADGTARLDGRRAIHVRDVLGARTGARIRVGVVGGRLGEAEVLASTGRELILSPRLDQDPPSPAPLEVLLALPRPKILRRVLQAIASMGVKRLVLCGSYRVERSYFGSPALAPDALRAELLLGLEQGRDTVLPQVEVRRLFKPLVEDELARLLPAPVRLVADPRSTRRLPPPSRGHAAAVAIGPEGGFTAYEAGLLQAHGFVPFTLGERVLRVDTAVSFAAGMILQWRGDG
jgi:RsmE family RNA methyltransferase